VFGWLSVIDNVAAALDAEGGGGGRLADLAAWPPDGGASASVVSGRWRRSTGALASLADAASAWLPIGLARMVEMTRAIVDPPRVLLLDEPISDLATGESAGSLTG